MGWFPCAAAVLGSPNAQGKPAQHIHLPLGGRTREEDRKREWVRRTKRKGREERKSGRLSRAGERAVKGKEGTVIATNRGLGKRKRRKGSRGRKCINKTSQTGVQ